MAGVGEASAIVGLIDVATQLSLGIVYTARKFKDARWQIALFGEEVGFLGRILDRLNQCISLDLTTSDEGVQTLTTEIIDESAKMFSLLDAYKDKLFGKAESNHPIGFRGRTKWVFDSKEIEYLRARVESMKSNIQLMLSLQQIHSKQTYFFPNTAAYAFQLLMDVSVETRSAGIPAVVQSRNMLRTAKSQILVKKLVRRTFSRLL